MSAVYNRAYSKFTDKADASAKAMLIVDLHERKQTAEMLGKTFKTLFDAVRNVKKGNFADAAKILKLHFVPRGCSVKKSLASNWLEFRYGWVPLTHTVFDCVEVLTRPYFPGWARGNATGTDIGSDYDGNWNPAMEHCYTRRWAFDIKCTIKAMVVGIDHSLVQAHQLGLTNPLTIVWEVIPFSFVVDWFVNVGDILQSLDDSVGITFGQGSVTWTLSGVSEAQEYCFGTPTVTSETCSAYIKTRSLFTAPQGPSFRVGWGLNAKRAADTAALFTTLLRSH